jgi:hypothetical protein
MNEMRQTCNVRAVDARVVRCEGRSRMNVIISREKKKGVVKGENWGEEMCEMGSGVDDPAVISRRSI